MIQMDSILLWKVLAYFNNDNHYCLTQPELATRMTKLRTFAAALSSLLLMSVPSGVAVAAVTDLGTLGGSYSFARDINASGQVTGESTNLKGETRAFIWKGAELIDLGTWKTHKFSMANGMNNHGQVVGYSRSSTNAGATKAILWEADGTVIVLPNLSGMSYAQGSEINDAGVVAGVSGTKAVIWKNKKVSALPSLGGDYSIALGINAKSWVVGNSQTAGGEVHAALWKDGKAVDLGTLGGRFSTANSINDQGQIVGSSETSDGEIHAFVWENGVMKDLGAGMIRNVNSEGVCAGESPLSESSDGVESSSQAVLWSSSGSVLRLDKLPHTQYSSAFGINDSGMIIGVSELAKSTEDESSGSMKAGHFHATLWAP
jgi:probable HAF family extracellular repeat protein